MAKFGACNVLKITTPYVELLVTGRSPKDVEIKEIVHKMDCKFVINCQ